MNTEQRKANEAHFLQYIKQGVKYYAWKDTGNVYDMSSGKMRPMTLKGYVELSGIVRKAFMDIFVDEPMDGEYNMKKVWKTIGEVSVVV